jgi:hypothetical protein
LLRHPACPDVADPLQAVSEECFFLFAVLFAKFAENFSDSPVPRVRTQGAADVRTTSCQFKHVSCSSIRHGGAAGFPRCITSVNFLCTRTSTVELAQSVAHDRVKLIYRRLLKEILRIVIS